MYTVFPHMHAAAAPSFQNDNYASDLLAYWTRSLYQRVGALIKFDGLPEAGPGQVEWDYTGFVYQLIRYGCAVVFRSKTYGVVVQHGTPYGFGLQWQPRGMLVNNQFFQFERPLEIGRECAVIKFTPDYRGVWDLIVKAATDLTIQEVSIRCTTINTRLQFAGVASDDNTAASIKGIYEQLQNGKPGITVNKNLMEPLPTDKNAEYHLPFFPINQDPSNGELLIRQYDALDRILTNFYRELGVRVGSDKKERLITAEQDSNDAEIFNRRQVWLTQLEKTLPIVNDMYGLDITAEINEPDREQEVNPNADVHQPSGEREREET